MVTYHRLLVPLDGSPASEAALPVAAAIARRTGASVLLVHIREEIDAAVKLAESYPSTLRDDPRLADVPELRADALDGPVQETLLAHADTVHADLIVMTSRGRGGITRALFGSVTDAIVRRAEVPVLVVRPEAGAAPAPGEPPFRRILLPQDGSEFAESIVPYVVALAGTEDVHYLVLRVRPALLPDGRIEPGPMLPSPSHTAWDAHLASIAARVAGRGVLVSERSVTHAVPADVIVEMAATESVDLIALTTRGAGGADRMIFGSVADEVVRRAPCSTLVLRPPAPAEPGLPPP